MIIKLKIIGRIIFDTPDFTSPNSPTAMRLTKHQNAIYEIQIKSYP